MRPQLTIAELLPQAATLLGQPFREWDQPAAGADHLVVIATTASGRRVVLKAGSEAHIDADVLRRLQPAGVPVPRLLASGDVAAGDRSYPLAIMTFVEGTLLAEVADAPHRYLASLIGALRHVHRVATTDGAGPVLAVTKGSAATWREYLLGILTGGDPEFVWPEIARSPWIDQAVLGQAIELVTEQVEALPSLPQASLLHGDLNPYNVFVQNGRISGIIDWSYARFGDPLFAFARLRMNPFIRSFIRCRPDATHAYFSLLNLGPAEQTREQTYYLFNLVEYVNWYVQANNQERVRDHLAVLARLVAVR